MLGRQKGGKGRKKERKGKTVGRMGVEQRNGGTIKEKKEERMKEDRK